MLGELVNDTRVLARSEKMTFEISRLLPPSLAFAKDELAFQI